MARRVRRLFDLSTFCDSQISDSADNNNDDDHFSNDHFVSKAFEVYGPNVFQPWMDVTVEVTQVEPLHPSDLIVVHDMLSDVTMKPLLPDTLVNLIKSEENVELFSEAEPLDEHDLWRHVVEDDGLLSTLKKWPDTSCPMPKLHQASVKSSKMLDLSSRLGDLQVMGCEDFLDLPKPSFKEVLTAIEGRRDDIDSKSLLSSLIGPLQKIEFAPMETQSQWQTVRKELENNEQKYKQKIEALRKEALNLCSSLVSSIVELSLQEAERRRRTRRPRRLTIQKVTLPYFHDKK